jgi:hypothetical protein
MARTGFGTASSSVRGLVESAQAGEEWYESNDGDVSFVETDEELFWAGTVYDVAFKLSDTGYGSGQAATWVMDISDDESISPGSSSPWNGWVGWEGGELTVAWQNHEIGSQGALTSALDLELDDPPTDEQWARLARQVVKVCFTS